MKTVSGTVELPCTPETFWRIFLDEGYTRAVFLEELGFRELTLIELNDSSRKLRAVPKVNMPAVLQKLVGDSFTFEEHGTLDRANNVWTWKMMPPTNQDPTKKPRKELVSTRGTVRVVPVGADKCRRSDDVEVEAHVFGLGGLIESTVEKELRASWAKQHAFFTRWLEK
jgi:hypothetical protein